MVEAFQARNHPLETARIAADTPDRYQQPLQDAVVLYGEELGHNLWALAQAVSDVSSAWRRRLPTTGS